MDAKIVLGLGYGDEGKGITTDFLCSQQPNSIVIRFSGGQQAGHTVVADGKRHIFSNFGAGTFRGAETYFSEHTTFYPVTMNRELVKLEKLGVTPKLTLHPLSRLTTPFDVFANRNDIMNCHHGTCGLGIGKTMKRNRGPYKLYAIDLLNIDNLMVKLANIGGYYNANLNNSYLKEELKLFEEAIRSINWNIVDYNYLTNFDNLVFEGSQGILLDMDHGVFPNVTYSNTTSKNAHKILDKLGVHYRDIYYVTRSYGTRHGTGIFQQNSELKFNDETNVTNEWQGNFRIGDIDYNLLNFALSVDNIYSNDLYKSMTVNKHLVVTCLDQQPVFNYNSINTDFVSIHESQSPDSTNFKKLI